MSRIPVWTALLCLESAHLLTYLAIVVVMPLWLASRLLTGIAIHYPSESLLDFFTATCQDVMEHTSK